MNMTEELKRASLENIEGLIKEFDLSYETAIKINAYMLATIVRTSEKILQGGTLVAVSGIMNSKQSLAFCEELLKEVNSNDNFFE